MGNQAPSARADRLHRARKERARFIQSRGRELAPRSRRQPAKRHGGPANIDERSPYGQFLRAQRAQLPQPGSQAKTPHRSSVSLSLLKRSRYAAMVLSSGPASPYEASFMSVLYVTAWLSFMARARKRPCASSGNHAIYEITPFSMRILRYFQCSFYAVADVVFTLCSLKVLRLASLARRSLNP